MEKDLGRRVSLQGFPRCFSKGFKWGKKEPLAWPASSQPASQPARREGRDSGAISSEASILIRKLADLVTDTTLRLSVFWVCFLRNASVCAAPKYAISKIEKRSTDISLRAKHPLSLSASPPFRLSAPQPLDPSALRQPTHRRLKWPTLQPPHAVPYVPFLPTSSVSLRIPLVLPLAFPL